MTISVEGLQHSNQGWAKNNISVEDLQPSVVFLQDSCLCTATKNGPKESYLLKVFNTASSFCKNPICAEQPKTINDNYDFPKEWTT